MTTHISNITFDAHDPYAQTVWWDQILEDFTIGDEDEPGDDECGLESPGDQAVLFLRVPEPKTVKNRLHLCLTAATGDRNSEVDRILGLGATIVDDRRTPEGDGPGANSVSSGGWVVFADPVDPDRTA